MAHDQSTALNELITTSLDGAHGYRQAAEHASDPSLKSLFEKYAKQRQTYASTLQAAVRQMGDKPTDDGSVSAAFHRGWIGLKDAVTTGDGPIVKECIRGEEYALKKFEKVAADTALPTEAKSIVTRLHGEISTALQHMRQIKPMAS